ncbi:ammonium transporter AmtB-like domain-containing protein [Lipomyces doorenjongii]|uniref:ammonium transporter AmtB-like domain-containing protein n=1 Tax=Lipomyces doorenjongii TaxID=383834 RepID=UPI0034CE55EA
MSEYPSDIFNETSQGWTAAGGNSQLMDVNLAYAPSVGHQVWLMISGVLIMPIIPGIGLFYAGEARRKSAMSILWQSMAILGIIPFQWFFWGYSLTYAADASPFIGTLTNFGLRNVISVPVGYIPEILFSFFQCMFCIETIVIMIGGAFERCRLLPSMVYAFCWATIVYCPIACWTWNSNGWLYKLGALDFAGGGPVHIASGVGALAFSLVLGKRIEHKDEGKMPQYHAHSPVMIYIGTIFIWMGWFGFNGGSTLNATVRTGYVLVNTNLAAATGVMGWNALEYVLYKGRFSVAGSCRGVMVGLVAITPAAGFVPVYFAAVIGFVSAVIVRGVDNWFNQFVGIDEGLMVFKNHAIGGTCGALMTGIFAANWVTALDGSSSASGWVDHNYIQLGYQLAEVCAIIGYTLVMSIILLYLINYIPGLKFRSEEHEEREGLDLHYLFNEGMGDHELFLVLKEAGFFEALAVKGQELLSESVSSTSKTEAAEEKKSA